MHRGPSTSVCHDAAIGTRKRWDGTNAIDVGHSLVPDLSLFIHRHRVPSTSHVLSIGKSVFQKVTQKTRGDAHVGREMTTTPFAEYAIVTQDVVQSKIGELIHVIQLVQKGRFVLLCQGLNHPFGDSVNAPRSFLQWWQ